MRCGRVDRLVERYVDGRLPDGLARAVAAHLDGCERCTERVEAARAVVAAFRGLDAGRAPDTLSSRIMEAVDREEAALRGQPGGTRSAAPIYRRLGYSFVATAALLAASLLVPHLAYPNLLHPSLLAASLGAGKPAAVARFVQDAGRGVGTVLSGEVGSGDR